METRELTPQEALSYLDDIAHGRKMEFDPHVLYRIVKRELELGAEARKILTIIFQAPSILQQLFELGQLGKEVTQRYMWGTITDSRVQKIKEFFADGKRDQSK